MTKEDKELLIRDLSSRLPYGVIVNVKGFDYDYNDKLTQIYKGYGCSIQVTTNMPYDIEQVKPYLFPMSSMTEEQEYEWDKLFTDPLCERVMTRHTREDDLLLRAKSGFASTEYLDKNFFDYRGLIPMGLALDATGLNIY